MSRRSTLVLVAFAALCVIAIASELWLLIQPHVGSASSAANALGQAVGAQLILGGLPITAAAFRAQVVSERIGLGALRGLATVRWMTVPLGLLVASVAADVALLAIDAPVILLQSALVVGALVVAASLVAADQLVLHASHAGLTRAAADQVDDRWWRTVIASRDRLRGGIARYDDPFLAIDGLIRLAITTADPALLRGVLGTLEARLERIAAAREPGAFWGLEAANFDDWLAQRWAGLVQEAAHERRGWALTTLAQFWLHTSCYGQREGPASTSAPYLRSDINIPTSAKLLRLLLIAAIDAGLEDTAGELLIDADILLTRLVATLPPAAQVPELLAPPRPNAIEPHAGFYLGCIALADVLTDLGQRALSAQLIAIARELVELSYQSVERLHRDCDDADWVRRLGELLTGAAEDLVGSGADAGACLLRYTMPTGYEADREADRVAAETTAGSLTRTIQHVGRLLDEQAVSQTGFFVLATAGVFPEQSAKVVRALLEQRDAVVAAGHAAAVSGMIDHVLKLWESARG
jgi:hypothetical protein